jgi:uncharacterized protein (DUF1778 family)
MPFLKQRNRIVVFRLSQDEYDSLRAACAAAGGRNVSDYTRSELLATIQSDSIHAVVQRRFVELDRRLADLHELVKELSTRIDAAAYIPTARAGPVAASQGR